MGTRKIIVLGVSGLIVLALGAASARAAGDDEATLKKRFEQRYPKLVELKKQGKIGETAEGLVDAVKPEYLKDADTKKLVADENSDRKQLFGLLAQKASTTPEVVAKRAAQRNFEKAKAGEYLRDKDKVWYKKA